MAFCFKEARLSTTLESDIEHNKFCGRASTIMIVISNKDSDILSQFDEINENEITILERLADLPPQILSTPHHRMLIKNHTDANKGKIKRTIVFRRHFWILQMFWKGNEKIRLRSHVQNSKLTK